MILSKLKESYREFERVIRKLQEIDNDMARIADWDILTIGKIHFEDDYDVEEIKAIVLGILLNRRLAAIIDGECCLQRILETLREIK